MSNNWTKWNGGECPVEKGVLVDVCYRNGEECLNVPALEEPSGRTAEWPYWSNDGLCNDIIAYRLSKPAQASSPRVVDADGWITHDGKLMPCADEEFVDIMLFVLEGESEEDNTELNTKAGEWYWEWDTVEPCIGCIVKWHYAKEQPQQEAVQEAAEAKHTHYFKDVSHLDSIDVYRTLELFNVTSPCLQHAIKKLLCAGIRGVKDVEKDVQEAIDSLERWKQMKKEDDA